MGVQFIEVSHAIETGMRTYPGLPVPEADVVLDREASSVRYAGKAEFFIASLHLCGNTGTYVDAPFHRYADGADLADVPLGQLAHLPFVVLDAHALGERAIGPELLGGADIAGKAVLIRTDASRHFGTERYFELNPFLTERAAEALRAAGAAFVGVDALNVDDMADLARPAHTTLLGAGIPICEHMTNLAALTSGRGRLHAVPIAWRGGASFPVRAYVIED